MIERQKSKGKSQKLFCISCFLLFTLFFLLCTPALAEDSSPSADFKTKLKILQEEIASKAANLKSEVNKRLLNKAYIGFIKSISETGIILTTGSEPKNIILNQYTEYSAKTGKITFKNQAEQNFIVALGDSDEKGILTAKKIIKTSSTSATLQQAFYGEVTTVTPNISINTKEGKKMTIKTDQETSFQLGKITADIKKVLVGKPIIAVGELNDQVLSARFIYIYPYSLLKPQTASSNSASSSAK